MEYILTRFRVKDSKHNEFKTLFHDMLSKRASIEASLNAAGIKLEAHFLRDGADGLYLYVFKKVSDHTKVLEVLQKPEKDVDQMAAHAIANYLEPREDLSAIATFDL